MKDMIRKSDVLRILETIRMETEMNRKVPATKRRAILGILENVTAKVDEISAEEEPESAGERNEGADTGTETEPEEETEKEPETPEVPIDCYLEPIMIGSTIGIERYHCRKCAALVEKNNKFCRKCGSRLGEIVEHRNMKWDTVRNVPVGTEAS